MSDKLGKMVTNVIEVEKNGVKVVIKQQYNKEINDINIDFSEHDKVFEDKIADLQQRIRELIKEKDEYKRKCNDFGFKNQELKKDYKTASELLGKYQQENERLKKRIIELENFSCQAEQETESLVEELKQCISELESENKQLKHDIDKMATSTSKWIERAVEWQQKCEKLESGETSELPFDPLECANYLINATYERETNSLERGLKGLPEKVNSDRYTVEDLEQIAEHLLVYCKHNKEIDKE